MATRPLPRYAETAPAPVEDGRFRTVAVTDVADLAALAPAWERLGSSLDSPMQSLAWLVAAAGLPGNQLEASCLLEGAAGVSPAALRAIAPLARRRRAGGRLEYAGGWELGEPVDFLWHDEPALGRLAEAIARQRRALLLARQPLDSPVLDALREAFGRRGLVKVVSRRDAPVIELEPGWVEPQSQLSPRRRSDLRRACRRALALGPLALELHAPSPDEVPPLLRVALRVEASSWKGRTGTALLYDRPRRAFYRRYAEAAAAAGELRVALLRIAGEPAAAQLAVVRRGAWWLLKIGYDDRYARCSPGLLLLAETIAAACREGLERYEFLGVSSEWTRVWTRRERPCATVLVYPVRPASLPLLARDAGRFLGARLGAERAR